MFPTANQILPIVLLVKITLKEQNKSESLYNKPFYLTAKYLKLEASWLVMPPFPCMWRTTKTLNRVHIRDIARSY